MKPRRNPKIVVFQSSKNQQWYFRVQGINGKIIAQSEGYTDHASAVRAVRSLQRMFLDINGLKIVSGGTI